MTRFFGSFEASARTGRPPSNVSAARPPAEAEGFTAAPGAGTVPTGGGSIAKSICSTAQAGRPSTATAAQVMMKLLMFCFLLPAGLSPVFFTKPGGSEDQSLLGRLLGFKGTKPGVMLSSPHFSWA